MIRYAELIEYIKENHINWNIDLFEVLRGFFEQKPQSQVLLPSQPIQQELSWEVPEVLTAEKFEAPADGEYSVDKVLELFSK